MNILVVNTGSSSLKYQLIDLEKEQVLAQGRVERIGISGSVLLHSQENCKEIRINQDFTDHTAAMETVFEILGDASIDAVGHRIVHGGEEFKEAVLVDKKVINSLRKLEVLAPLHMRANIAGVEACIQHMPGVPMVAVFDTAFHQTIPKKAFLYGIPLEAYQKHKIRRYGFHGTSHRYVAGRVPEIMKIDKEDLKIISCHLGNGSSIAAIQNGKVIDTSMGFTPLEGLVMGTRCGDIDPAIIQYLMQSMDMTIEETIHYLNACSGVLGLSGLSSDFRDLFAASSAGNPNAKTAIDVFCYRVKKYIGSYIAALGNVDVIAFTGGIAENSPEIRDMVLSGMDFIDARIDKESNARRGERIISAPDAKVKIIVVPANEEMMIAKETYRLL